MSATIDYAASYCPVFGEDITVTGYTDKFDVIGHQFKSTSEEVTAREVG